MADNIQTRQELDIVLIVRNDKTTAWESSTYKLEKGEMGIGYYDNGKVIVKVGSENGDKTWKECAQVEGVFEDDLTLTYAFGKYSPGASGSFELRAAGKTMSEVMLDAFAEEVYEGLILTTPSVSFARASGVSESNSGEVGTTHGSPAVKLDLNITGSYKYGAKDSAGNNTSANITATSARITLNDSTVKSMAADDPNADLSYTHTLSGDLLKYREDANGSPVTDTYTFKAYASHGADANRPLTNLGNFVAKDADDNYYGTKTFADAIGHIAAKSETNFMNGSTVTVKYTAYRKMFMAVSDTDATEANGALTSAFVRGLSTVSEKAAKTSKEFSVAAGKKYFYVAIPESLTTTAPDVYYKPFSNWESFSTVEYVGKVNVQGANSYAAAPYRVYRGYSETGKFDGDTSIKVTVK